jgi:hypothetical protein
MNALVHKQESAMGHTHSNTARSCGVTFGIDWFPPIFKRQIVIGTSHTGIADSWRHGQGLRHLGVKAMFLWDIYGDIDRQNQYIRL